MAFSTVKIKKYLDVVNEGVADGAITPGMLLEISGAGTNGHAKYKAHASAEAAAGPFFALEDELQGKDITEAYVDGTPVQVWVAQPGEEVYAILATSQAITVGALLSSHGDGTLQAFDGTTPADAQIVGVALEAVTTTSSTARIRVMII